MEQWKFLLTSNANGEDLGRLQREGYFKETVFPHCYLF